MERAKRAYETFGHRAEVSYEAWEHLSNRQQAAWLETVRSIEEEYEEVYVPCCPLCDTEMVCIECDGGGISCSVCAAPIEKDDEAFCEVCRLAKPKKKGTRTGGRLHRPASPQGQQPTA